MTTKENLCRLSTVARADIIYENETGELIPYFAHSNDSVILRDGMLRLMLRTGASGKSVPCVQRDGYNIYYAVMQRGRGWLYIGPMAGEKLSPESEKRYYARHGTDPENASRLRVFSLRQIYDLVQLASILAERSDFDEARILYLNQAIMDDDYTQKQEQLDFIIREEEDNDDDAYRHTYREEQRLLDAVTEGRVQDALRFADQLDVDAGRLSAHSDSHWRNLSIVGITLCSRAAIWGGLTPETAYRISGYYINKCDAFQDPVHILHNRNRAIEELVTRVYEQQNRPHTSSYVERCRDYINKHYREKIYLEDLAEMLKLSPAYLSRLFKQKTGICLQDYINQVRVERAAKLLAYSDKPLPAIASYVRFPNQSYLGKMFKKYKGMTPKEYRDRYKVREAIDDN